MPRRFPIIQFPNRPLIAAMAAGTVALATDGEMARRAGLVAQTALLVWAYEEIVGGANWFRRLLGLSGGAGSVVTIARLAQQKR